MKCSWDVWAQYYYEELDITESNYVASFTNYEEAYEYAETLMRNDPDCYAWLA